MDSQYAKVYQMELPPFFEYKGEWDEEVEAMVAKFLNKHKEALPPQIKRGDFVRITSIGDAEVIQYRNDGMFIFDGKKMLVLDSDLDEYGAVPKSFLTFTEFPVRYLTAALEHNSIHHIDLSKFQVEKSRSEDGLYVYSFFHDGKKYTIASMEPIRKKIVSVEMDHDDYVGYDFSVYSSY